MGAYAGEVLTQFRRQPYRQRNLLDMWLPVNIAMGYMIRGNRRHRQYQGLGNNKTNAGTAGKER